MNSVKSTIPWIAIIILTCIVLFFTLRDIVYDQQIIQLFNFIMKRQTLQRIIILYCILIIFGIFLIFSRFTKNFETIIHSKKRYEKLLKNKLNHFKCPNCNGIFTIKKTKNINNKSVMITCPSCRTIGRISTK